MQVLSSLSGIPFYAPSAGFAPTNSADVSAIASAYQVVSATATQLNAGTAYLTSVNETPISAARAGNAANASLANSAWYDGTGRMISSLPDEATVSSIASAYAESAASGKQNTLSFSYDDDKISAINGSALAGQGGVDSATVSAIASAYAESAASGKQNSGNYISATGFKQGIFKTTSTGSQYILFGGPPEIASGNAKAGIWLSGEFGTAYYKDNELNLNRNNMKIAFNIGGAGPKISSMATGAMHSYMYLFASGNNSGTYSETGIQFKDSSNNTVALYDSATYGNITSVYDTVSANSASWGGGGGGVDSATVSAIASSYAESAASSKLDESATADFYATSNPSGFITGVDLSDYTTTAYVDSSVSGKLDSTAQVVTSINVAYPATGGTFISQINGTNIFAVTAHSAGDWIGASSKADSSALSSYALSADVSGTISTVSTYSADWNSAYSLISGVTALLDAI